MPVMPLLRKDLRIGLLAGSLLLVLAVIYATVLTFSGSPEPEVVQRPADAPAEPNPLAQEPADAPTAGSEQTIEPLVSPLPDESLARTSQVPAGDWSAYFNGNPPIVTETPSPGASLPSSPLTLNSGPVAENPDPGVTAADGMTSTQTHVVASGETLSAIAQKYYGDANLYQLIEKANPRLNPLQLRVGQKLLIPDRDTTRAPGAQAPLPKPAGPEPASANEFHEVQPGDTLARIAARRFGREALWEKIYELNRDQIGADPARLKVGMKLKLPS
jgi:nucleoid-associated protein YgaU